jgi:serine/threonine-protein kinase
MPEDDAFEIDLGTGAGPPPPPGGPAPPSPPRRKQVDHGRFPPGTLLGGRYRIKGLLGRGGMGEVYRAEDLRLGEDVALKFLEQSIANHPGLRARFISEAKVARKLTHANLCRVHDFVEADGESFLSMEFVDGEDLASLLERVGRLDHDKAIDVAQQLCLGLAAAHERGVLHRDLKPANVMVDARGRVRLMDFGLAALTTEITDHSAHSGTPRYMAPEQLRGGELTPRTDLYALGLVMHEMFTGSFPSAEYLSGSGAAPVATGVHPDVLRAIAACLEPDARRRPPGAIAVAIMLPGGDPLAAAVRAGELPSPAMVAAAASPDAVPRGVAAALAAAAILGLVLVATYTVTINPFLAPAGWVRPPEALVDRCKDIARSLGGPALPAHEAAGIAVDEAYLAELRRTRRGAGRWRPLREPAPAGAAVWWRGSPRPLASFEAGYAATETVPPRSDGDVAAKVSLAGDLLAYEARLAAKPAAGAPAGAALDQAWPRLFASAGLDFARFRDVAPGAPTPVGADGRRAWEGPAPGTTAPVRVEAAALGGAVTRFEVLHPWHLRRDDEGDSEFLFATEQVVQLVALLVFMVFAVRNVRRHRADARAATRLGAFLSVCGVLYWLFQATALSGESGFYWAVAHGAGQALFVGLFGASMYLAIEPFVRRRVPHLLMGSTRILEGRLLHPVVGRDILVGAAGAFVIEVLIAAVVALAAAGVETSAPPRRIHESFGLYGLRQGIAELFRCVRLGPTMALLLAGTFAGLFAVLKRRAPAIGIAVLLGGVLFAKHWVFDAVVVQIVFGTLTAAVGFYVLSRCGVLAACVFGILAYANAGIPVTFDPRAWYAGSAVAYVVAFAGLVAWGWVAATRRQALGTGSAPGWPPSPAPSR